MPSLRELVTYKNTVAGSIKEIKALVAEVFAEAQIPASTFNVDYSLMNDDNLWYLRQISNNEVR